MNKALRVLKALEPGAAPLKTSWRMGLADIHTALKAFPDSIANDALGSPTSPTPQEVFREGEKTKGKEGEAKQPTKEPAKEIEPPEPEM